MINEYISFAYQSPTVIFVFAIKAIFGVGVCVLALYYFSQLPTLLARVTKDTGTKDS